LLDVDVDGVEVQAVYVVRYEDKVEAVVECLKSGRGFTIRELRGCAGRHVAVSEKVISRILRELETAGVAVKVYKRWYYAGSLGAGLEAGTAPTPSLASTRGGIRGPQIGPAQR